MDDTPNSDLVKIKVQLELNLTHTKPSDACYRTSESPILAKTFVCVVWKLQDRRLLMFWAHR